MPTTVYNIGESVLYLFTAVDDVQFSKHALTSLLTYLPRTVVALYVVYSRFREKNLDSEFCHNYLHNPV